MPELAIKPGDRLTVDGDVVIQLDRVCGGCAHLTVDALDDISVSRGKAQEPAADMQDGLGDIAEEVISRFSEADAAASQEMLARFVSDLFYALAQKRQREERRERQAEGIAAAKARGVRFGAQPKPLPDNFAQCYQAWQEGEMTAAEAAQACGMARKSFYNASARMRDASERAAECG